MPPPPIERRGGAQLERVARTPSCLVASSKDLLGSHGHRAIDMYTNYTHCEGRGVRRMGETCGAAAVYHREMLYVGFSWL